MKMKKKQHHQSVVEQIKIKEIENNFHKFN